MKINRKIGPPIQPLSDIKLPEVSFYTLSNGLPVYEVNTGTQDAFKIEVLLMGGIGLEPTLRTNYAIRNFAGIVVPSHLPKLVSCCQSVANSLETIEGIDEIDDFYPHILTLWT